MDKKIIIIATAGFIIFFIAYTCGLIYFFPDLLTKHDFQNLFAGITAFFSGLAFLGVIGAILLQKDELSLQRKELKLTRKELERTAKTQEKSELALSRQAESLKVTAKLNGLSSLLQRYMVLRDVGIAKYGSGGVDKQWDEKAKDVSTQIEAIISDK
ncbi:MAG: hypothetical protein WAX80_00365 [Minisyncoccia bacterium]